MDTIKDIPREFELEDLIEKLVFVEKIEKGFLFKCKCPGLC